MRKRPLRLYCFSPPVMILTFVVEIGLLAYTLIRYQLTNLTRIVGALLLLLAVFQLAEYNVCGGFGASAQTWSRIGYVAITFLPALGIHVIQTISGKPGRKLTWFAYSTAGAWAYFFGLSERAFSGHICAGNYVIFQLNAHYGFWYYVYYYSWLFVGIMLCLMLAQKAKPNIREALILQAAGYMVFVLPTTIVNSLKPASAAGLPSIMCGFAVLYALILVFGIVPLMEKVKEPKETFRLGS